MVEPRQYMVKGGWEITEVLKLRMCETFFRPCLTHEVPPLVSLSQTTLSRVLGREGALSFESEDLFGRESCKALNLSFCLCRMERTQAFPSSQGRFEAHCDCALESRSAVSAL